MATTSEDSLSLEEELDVTTTNFSSAPTDNEEAMDSPEALVRKESRMIKVAGILVVVALLIAATITSVMIYKHTSSAEQDSFETGFASIATKIVEGLESDVALKFWMARTIASAVTLAMDTSTMINTNLTISPQIWETLTQESRFTGNAVAVIWSPMLYNDDERKDFEDYSKTKEFTIGANDVCFVCGSADRGYTNPDKLIDLVGFGTYPCSTLENSGRQGIIPNENCIPITQAGEALGCLCDALPPDAEVVTNTIDIPDKIFFLRGGEKVFEEPGTAPYHPIWQTAVLDAVSSPVMFNQMSHSYRQAAIENMLNTSMPIMSETFPREGEYYDNFAAYPDAMATNLYYPVFDPSLEEIVGSVTLEMLWSTFMTGVFPPKSEHVDVVIENSCGQSYTFGIDTETNTFVFVGQGDLHDETYGDRVQMTTYEQFEAIVNFAGPVNKNQSLLEYCRYRYMVFPTERLEEEYVTSNPLVFSLATGFIFLLTSLVFIFFDQIVRRRQRILMAAAKRTNDIVQSLFPEQVRERLIPTKMQMQSFLANEDQGAMLADEPIADLFPHTTIMFLDISGFTAWCSEREPSQVFRLLESVFGAFDEISKQMGVFKVETVGDSYVAVCGLPQPRESHAIVMAQFATNCLKRMHQITRELEVHLGPSTGDLRARVGLHSGPVTAGVLRGEKARFQLFGDTMNTAARLESTGKPNRIQCSKATRDLLVARGKEAWVTPRDNKVTLKGKGEFETFWIDTKAKTREGSTRSGSDFSNDVEDMDMEEDIQMSMLPSSPELSNMKAKRDKRLVAWNTQVLRSLLEKVMAGRQSQGVSRSSTAELRALEGKLLLDKSTIVIDEMTQILEMPQFNKQTVTSLKQTSLKPLVNEQLHSFVATIASMYRDVPFHNFEHVSHVIMSASKILKRIMTPDGIDYQQRGASNEQEKQVAIAEAINGATFGISSDFTMHFAVVFSALIHDVDHTGLTNAELIKLNSPVAETYRQKSVAEQNSVDLAWAVLMEEQYKDLRACIYSNVEELKRFRQLLVNAVMATDIADKELKSLRENRWNDAFSETAVTTCQNDINRKATITFEYIIQASDIAHTMQHWHTYQKFNARLFEERYVAWAKYGMGDNDPSKGWYGGELWFFDNYIIPLASKLDTCGVFGVSYHESLSYAVENRKEWVSKGEEIVKTLLAKCQEKYGTEQIALGCPSEA